jgi:CRISPR-associated protein (TIGR03986 family)
MKNNNYQKSWNNNKDTYVGAPYNFVSFSDKVYTYPEEKLTGHNAVDEELFTGELDYELTAQTPIFVDGGTGEFHRDPYGNYSIPGSTMRGLIRNNVQILGLCSMADDIDDYALMYRSVAGGADKDLYKTILGANQIRISDGDRQYGLGVLANVRAGYLKNENGKYVIYQTKVDKIKKEMGKMNYYVLSERRVVKDPDSYPFFRQNGKSIMQHEFKKFERREERGRVHYRGTKNDFYVPYCKPVSYEVKNQKDIVAVGNPGVYSQSGYAVSSGKMNEKKAIYIIPEIDMQKERIEIPQKDIEAFKIDLNKKENTLKQFGGRTFFDLPEPGEQKCVFYIRLGEKRYFGFTPRLRLFYDHTIRKGIPSAHCTGKLDYAKSMFGFSSSAGSYKSKLSFSDAVVTGEAKSAGTQQRVLAEPKPSSCLDYVRQSQKGEISTYNQDGFQLRGMKQYWLRDGLVQEESVKNEKVGSTLKPLAKGTKFRGKIRFRNLTKEEFGLLLWSVRLEKDSRMNVGKGKAYGYGNVEVELGEIRCVDTKRAYVPENGISLTPFLTPDAEEYITCYKDSVKAFLGGKNIEELPSVWEFFAMKDATRKPDPDKIRYMKIDKPEREYQNRKKPLPTIRQTISQNKGAKN